MAQAEIVRMAQAEFFDIVRQGTFFMDIKPCLKIEELSDAFMTRENLELMNGDNPNWEWNSRIYMGGEIREALKEWATMIPEGAFCTGKMSSRVKLLTRELQPYQLRNYIHDGFTVRGDRIINKNIRSERQEIQARKEEKASEEARALRKAMPYVRADFVTHKDRQYIIDTFDRYICDEFGLEVHRHYRYEGKRSIFEFMKRHCGWDLIAKLHRKHAKKKEYLQDLKFMKKLWDDPTLDP